MRGFKIRKCNFCLQTVTNDENNNYHMKSNKCRANNVLANLFLSRDGSSY